MLRVLDGSEVTVDVKSFGHWLLDDIADRIDWNLDQWACWSRSSHFNIPIESNGAFAKLDPQREEGWSIISSIEDIDHAFCDADIIELGKRVLKEVL